MPSRAAILLCWPARSRQAMPGSRHRRPAWPRRHALRTRAGARHAGTAHRSTLPPCSQTWRDSVLAMRSAWQQGIFGALRQRRQGGENGSQLLQEDVMRLVHLQELPGLRDVLGGRAPVHVPTSVSLTDPIQFPDERHERMACTRQPGMYRFQVNVREVGFMRNLLGSASRDDAQVCLASASAASTFSHAWKRAASVNRARTPGSSIRNEVGSSWHAVCLLSQGYQCQLALAQSPFQQPCGGLLGACSRLYMPADRDQPRR